MALTEKTDDSRSNEGEFDLTEIFVTPDTSSADLQDLKIGFLIHDVSRLRRIAFDHLMKPLGITRAQWWVIAHLSRDDGMVQTELAELLDIGKAALGGMVDRLEAGGWVQRRPDALDRRIKRVFLAPAAHEVIRKMQAVEQQQNRDMLKGFSRESRAYLADMLARLRRNLQPE